jgi:hypothetical protein
MGYGPMGKPIPIKKVKSFTFVLMYNESERWNRPGFQALLTLIARRSC